MTVVVGILNRRGAVLAADSAVTVNNAHGTKIYNSATKIFPLSAKSPVGVMIYNNAMFMTTPLDVIFELYRARRGDQKFDTLKEYADDFLDFLRCENYFTDADGQKEYFEKEVSDFYRRVNDTVEEEWTKRYGEDADYDEKIVAEIMHAVLEGTRKDYAEDSECEELKDYPKRSMTLYGKDIFDAIKEDLKGKDLPANLKTDIVNTFHKYLKSSTFHIWSGLAFVGFGEKDIYPSILSMYLGGVIEGRLRYAYLDDAETIGMRYSALIRPYAQRDVIDNMIWGIHPSVESTVLQLNRNAIESTREKILKELEKAGVKQSVIEKVTEMDLDEVKTVFGDSLEDYERNSFIDGILDAVESFNMSDVANMAESLVSLTYMQRHISSSEETVGGPIDVAVITKVGGFQWVKHKPWPPPVA